MALLKGSTDQPATEDDFGIGNYISGLCSFITECDTPMTIAIQGDWGSGKTSIMEMVREKIDKSRVQCVWFNTWQYSQFNTADNLSLSLMETIIDGLKIDGDEHVEEMRSGIGKLGAAVKRVARAVSTPVAVGAEMLTGSQVLAETLRDKLQGNEENAPDEKAGKTVNETIEGLKTQFQNCINRAVEKREVNRILIFIDDLDRLQPLRAVELLEVLKIFLDCEKCVFILALDYAVVVSGIKRKYNDDMKEDKGRSFFDKIIQVPFKMPVAQYDISRFVRKALEDVTAVKFGNDDISNFISLINRSIGSNPRSMKRLFNSYLLLLKVIDKEICDVYENKKALFAILCMQQRFEDLYNYIVINIVVNEDSEEGINADFFNMLAGAEDPGTVLQSIGINAKDGESKEIKEFIVCFNKTLNPDGSGAVSGSSIERLRVLFKSSSITATEAAPSGAKKRPTFIYKGETYMAQGAKKMNLSNLAMRLIKDYAELTDKTPDEYINMINSAIQSNSSMLRGLNIGQVTERSNPLLKRGDVMELHFSGKDEIIKMGGATMLVSKCWGSYELIKLIELFGYKGRVSSNIME